VILITGASGRIARRTAELLGRSGHRLRLMTRSPQRAPKLAEAETVRGDFAEPATLEEAFAGVTTALVVSGSGQPGERARLHSHAFQSAAQARVRTRRVSVAPGSLDIGALHFDGAQTVQGHHVNHEQIAQPGGPSSALARSRRRDLGRNTRLLPAKL
jgi:uncharacterized protein YbjT (DUF2867 family)